MGEVWVRVSVSVENVFVSVGNVLGGEVEGMDEVWVMYG